MMHSKDTIEWIRQAVDPVEVVSAYVPLKRQGRRFAGRCPFHDDRTPSFCLDPDRGLYVCYGCGEGGDLFRFVQEVTDSSFPEAVELLAEHAGITLPGASTREGSAGGEKVLSEALDFAASFYHETLLKTNKTAEAARRYLSGRAIDQALLKRFRIGLAPDCWNTFTRAAQASGISKDALVDAGLSRRGRKGLYDCFRARLVFPLADWRGRVCGFAGRALGQARTERSPRPKYTNTSDTALFKKSRLLFGLAQARAPIRAEQEVFVVEGYTDALVTAGLGIENVVATGGTSVTEEQIERLSRYAPRILFVGDGDEAGVRMMQAGVRHALKHGATPYAVRLPAGEDPASFLAGDAQEKTRARERLLGGLCEGLYFLAETAGSGARSSVERTVAATDEIAALLPTLPAPHLRAAYARHAAYLLDLDAGAFEETAAQNRSGENGASVKNGISEKNGPGQAAGVRGPDADETERLEEQLLRQLLVEEPATVRSVLGLWPPHRFTDEARAALARALNRLAKKAHDRHLRLGPLFAGKNAATAGPLAARLLLTDSPFPRDRAMAASPVSTSPYETLVRLMTKRLSASPLAARSDATASEYKRCAVVLGALLEGST